MIDLQAEITALGALLGRLRAEALLAPLPRPPDGPWPEGQRLVLGSDVALDLGHPVAGAVGVTLWGPATPSTGAHSVWRAGPDVADLAGGRRAELGARPSLVAARPDTGDPKSHGAPPPPRHPFGLAIRIRMTATATDDAGDYALYLDIRQRLYGLHLDGVALRSRPSEHQVWLRLHHDAIGGGFTLAHLGWGLVDTLSSLPGTEAVEILLLTLDRAALAPLRAVARQTQRRVAALVKRNEELETECGVCDYADVCAERDHASSLAHTQAAP